MPSCLFWQMACNRSTAIPRIHSWRFRVLPAQGYSRKIKASWTDWHERIRAHVVLPFKLVRHRFARIGSPSPEEQGNLRHANLIIGGALRDCLWGPRDPRIPRTLNCQLLGVHMASCFFPPLTGQRHIVQNSWTALFSRADWKK